jgi:hypothetical protein
MKGIFWPRIVIHPLCLPSFCSEGKKLDLNYTEQLQTTKEPFLVNINNISFKQCSESGAESGGTVINWPPGSGHGSLRYMYQDPYFFIKKIQRNFRKKTSDLN